MSLPELSLSDAAIAPLPAAPAPALPHPQRRWSDGAVFAAQAADPNAPWSMQQHWPALVATLSEQAVESSNLVLRALDFLVGAGRLRRAEAKALSDAMYKVRDTSLRAQQITRLASGRIHHAKDRVELAEVVREVLQERDEEFAAAGVKVTGELNTVDVLLDPPVAMSLVNSLLDWALSFSREVVLQLDTPVWPAPAKLVARVTTPKPGSAPAGRPGAAGGAWGTRERGRRQNDGLHWLLLRQMAASANLQVTRSGGNGVALLTVEFPQTFQSSDGISSVELFEQDSPAAASLLNAWVLVVARDNPVRTQAMEALRHAGIAARAAGDWDEARRIVAEGRPNAMVVAWDVTGTKMYEFRSEMLGDVRCPLIEVTASAPSFNTDGFLGFEVPKVGRETVKKELGPTVLFELAKMI